MLVFLVFNLDEEQVAQVSWQVSEAAAVQFLPAERWRRTLAAALVEDSGAPFAVACTCPPGMTIEPSATAEPAAYGRVVEQILQEFLPKVERAGDGAAAALRLGPGAYAPLLMARDQGLAQRFQRELLSPMRVQGMLNAFMFGEGGEVIGWLALGTRAPSAAALEAFGAQLSRVALLGSQTLQSAIALAAACGVVPAPAKLREVSLLTAREREVAALVVTGLSDVAVAGQLGMSEQTVGTHLRKIFQKVGVHSRAELVSRVGTLLSRQR